MTLAELLREAAAGLPRREGLPEPAREARALLALLLGTPESWLIAHGDDRASPATVEAFRSWVRRRAGGEPAHYIAGRCPFWGREYLVTPAVLIPRPETELVVEEALRLTLPPDPRVLDVGTGSGCLAVTLALEVPAARVTATDVSLAALAVARTNAERLGAAVALAAADLAAAVAGTFDLVVANLPYVPEADLDALAPEVRLFEPRGALVSGADGLDAVRRILAALPALLTASGVALLEVGPGHATRLRGEAPGHDLAVTGTVTDPGGVERILVLRR